MASIGGGSEASEWLDRRAISKPGPGRPPIPAKVQALIRRFAILVVPTAGFRLLYAWFVVGHGRREILHFGVTEHPTSPWVIQQLREAFPDDTAPRFLILDNDSIFSDRVADSIEVLGIEPRRTAFK